MAREPEQLTLEQGVEISQKGGQIVRQLLQDEDPKMADRVRREVNAYLTLGERPSARVRKFLEIT